jgi:hypothetical protein
MSIRYFPSGLFSCKFNFVLTDIKTPFDIIIKIQQYVINITNKFLFICCDRGLFSIFAANKQHNERT